ncbi:hypothetical protein PAAG_12059 [Paracoccidioides lutzii Pb01]|uniref:Uncharacterized protein n=1 Tax=Paracoccidioides lutzii (strain ATCC MYA-826 / Pb01) TaxID=502779 RepID=A0A0A2V1C3_PARBA|nr:hypothetical protein PAAG_12059 [Paracoccidioides lutzii Pb01]KGQ01288.1 hypothetical protein PAAG_12059 [Paracoccidioides lutzii Pb01]
MAWKWVLQMDQEKVLIPIAMGLTILEALQEALQILQPHSDDILVDGILGCKYQRTGKHFQWYDMMEVWRFTKLGRPL